MKCGFGVAVFWHIGLRHLAYTQRSELRRGRESQGKRRSK